MLYFIGGGAKAPLSLQLPATVVQDMEVIDEDGLSKLIAGFVKTNKLKPSSLLICFSHACYFQKDVPEKATASEIVALKAEFDDNVPFNKVLSREFTQGKKVKIIGINRDLAYAIKHGFDILLFETEGIVPLFALYGEQAVTFNTQMGEQLMKHYNSLQQITFPVATDDTLNTDPAEIEYSGEKKKSSNRTLLLLGVFVFLLLILILFYMIMKQKRAAPPPVNESSQQATVVTVPTVLPSPSETPTPVPTVQKELIAIQVLNGSGIPGQADLIKARLEDGGFVEVTTGNAPTQTSEKTSIVFKPSTPRSYRQEITTALQLLGFDLSIREAEDIEFDVLITTVQ